MKTFKQFIIEANEAAADRIEQRRQIAKDKSRTAAKDFKARAKNQMRANKQKAQEMAAKSQRDSENAKKKRALQDYHSRQRARQLGSAVRQTVSHVVKSGIRRIAR